MAIRPLPLSLAPIPDESLPGYLMRLAHRYGISPNDLARILGLNRGSQSTVPLNHFLGLDSEAVNRISYMTRQTPAEVQRLTYADLQGTYPSVRRGQKLQVVPSSARVMSQERWLFTTATRYCPQCLAGDGSEIQDEHGGGWNRLWRLPIYFACLTHRRVLSHRCPTCRMPALTKNPPATSQLIPAADTADLHPMDCRALALTQDGCVGRFDTLQQDPAEAAALEPRDTATLLNLQHRFNELLRAHPDSATATSAGTEVTSAQYFADLRAVTTVVGQHPGGWNSLVSACSWITAESSRLIERADAHARSTLERTDAVPSWARGSARPGPLDPLEHLGALALAAELIDTAADPVDLSDRLTRIFPDTAPTAQHLTYLREWTTPDRPCSDAMRQAVAALHIGSALNATGKYNRHKCHLLVPAIEKPERLTARNIPQIIPPEIWTERFPQVSATSRRSQRRQGAAIAVAAIENVDVAQAGRLLKIPETTPCYFAPLVDALGLAGLQELHKAVRGFVEELGRQQNLVDLRHRQDYLKAWKFPTSTWRSMLRRAHLDDVDTWADKGQHLATTYTWTRITQGDPHLAPTKVGHSVHPWMRLTSHYLDPATPVGRLRELLDEYSDRLSGQIDSQARHVSPPAQGADSACNR